MLALHQRQPQQQQQHQCSKVLRCSGWTKRCLSQRQQQCQQHHRLQRATPVLLLNLAVLKITDLARESAMALEYERSPA